MELAAVGAFFADDFCRVRKFRVFNQQSAAFAHAVVLCLVVAVAAEVSECAEGLPLVGGHHALGGVFHHQQIVLSGDFVNLVHFAGHSRVVDGDDGLCLFGNGLFHQIFVHVHGVGADIHEHAFCTSGDEGVGGGNEGEGGHDDFIAGLNGAQVGCHFQGMGAAGGEKGLCGVCMLFEPDMALLVEGAVATDAAAFYGLLHVLQLCPEKRCLIKRNSKICHRTIIVTVE